MPTQTKFICPSGGVNVDFSGVFEPLNGGSSYASATNYKVGALDLTGIFHVSTSVNDRPSFNTGYKLSNNADLSTIFRRYGFAGITITSQPTNQVVVNNSTATFSITATALGTPTYQWYKDSLSISGATSSSYTTSSLTTANDSDSYYCVVSYGGSSVNSNSVSSKIKPYITSQPSNLNVNDAAGAQAFQVAAAGSGTIFYQWYRGATLLGTNNQHVMNPVTASDIGNYYCKVTSSYDSIGVNSNTVSLSIIAPDVSIGITGFNSPYEFNEGQVITITPALTAGTNVTYQWYGPNGVIANGQNGYNILSPGNDLQFALSTSNDGSYYVIATNQGGSDTSTSINIVIRPPIITAGITGYNAPFCFNIGVVITITASIAQGENITYQWYGPSGLIANGQNGYNIINQGAGLQFTLSNANAATYYVRATNGGGYDDSNTIAVQVSTAPIIAAVYCDDVPADNFDEFAISNDGNSSVEFVLSASVNRGCPQAAGGWYLSGDNGSTFTQLMNPNNFAPLTQPADTTKYYQFKLSNTAGAVASNIIVVTSS